jgi:hypothetical protein
MNRPTRCHSAFGTAVVAAVIVLLLVVKTAGAAWRLPVQQGILTGAAVGLVLAVLGYASLALVWQRGIKLVYAVFAAGVLLRLAAVLVMTWIAGAHAGLSVPAVLLSLVGVYIPLSFAEVALLAAQGDDPTGPSNGESRGK